MARRTFPLCWSFLRTYVVVDLILVAVLWNRLPIVPILTTLVGIWLCWAWPQWRRRCRIEVDSGSVKVFNFSGKLESEFLVSDVVSARYVRVVGEDTNHYEVVTANDERHHLSCNYEKMDDFLAMLNSKAA